LKPPPSERLFQLDDSKSLKKEMDDEPNFHVITTCSLQFQQRKITAYRSSNQPKMPFLGYVFFGWDFSFSAFKDIKFRPFSL